MIQLSKKPFKIGLTGGIGSGKTTVAKIFKSLGVPVFNSDECGKQLIINNKEVIQSIINVFGEEIVNNNKIQLTKLSQIVSLIRQNNPKYVK